MKKKKRPWQEISKGLHQHNTSVSMKKTFQEYLPSNTPDLEGTVSSFFILLKYSDLFLSISRLIFHLVKCDNVRRDLTKLWRMLLFVKLSLFQKIILLIMLMTCIRLSHDHTITENFQTKKLKATYNEYK